MAASSYDAAIKADKPRQCAQQTWAVADSANNEEKGSLVMMIALMRLDGLYQVTQQMSDDGRCKNNRGGGHRDSGGRGGWPLPLPLL
jgi:hypothetical protein